ncbi:MAG: hypothetical protein J5746_13665 [Victivallales bacterium]|nr:hypothetical protein [Victivallales bacterium]
MKSRIIDWITYILNILLIIPFIGIVAAWVVGLVYFGLFRAAPTENASFTYVAGALALGLTVLWGIYQYRMIILKQPKPKGESRVLWIALGIFLLCILLGLWGISRARTTFHINAETYQEFIGHFGSAKRKVIAITLVPEGSTNIAFFEKNKSFSHYMLVKCNCTEDQLQSFASQQGYAFTPKPNAISQAWIHFNHNDSELKTIPTKALVYENRRPNGSGVSFLYDVEQEILYSEWSNR